MMFKWGLLLSVAALCNASVPADEVKGLPGWDKPLPSAHFSGYLSVGNSSSSGHLHYWFIEAESDPATAPVVLWLNGGPGSSSLIGALTENGQFMLNDDSITPGSNTLRLLYNKYGWTQKANVLYLESPKGVGFSYCDQTPCSNTDESTASDAADAIQAFFKAYSEYAGNDFFITGESYAGIYIPMLMAELDKRGGTSLKGAAIGDGCWGNAVGTCAFASPDSVHTMVEFFAGHGMYPQTLYSEIVAACGNYANRSVRCDVLLGEMNVQIGSFDTYNIYDDCGNDQIDLATLHRLLAQPVVHVATFEHSLHPHPALAGALNDYACGAQDAMSKWLRDPAVIAALHVKANTQGMHYIETVADLRPVYKTLAQKYRILIYSGSVDACVPYYGSEIWTRELGFNQTAAWRPWVAGTADKPLSRQQAGYVTTYSTGASSPDFTFLTVTGAGHMVPQFRPVRALAMFERFLNGKGY